MAKQLNVALNINTQTDKAKAALSELNNILTNIQTKKTININDTSLQEAKQAASDLKLHLAQATSVDTGKLNLGIFSQSLKKAGQDLNTLYNKLSVIGPEGQKAFIALSQSIVQADHVSLTLGNRFAQLMTTLKNTARWQISSSILHGFMGALQGAYGYAQDLNKSLNNIRIVTGQSIDQMARFADEANRAAKALSTSTTAYTDAALIYYQQGLGDQAVKERTETTLKLSNVSRQSAEEVSNQMTAIWNNFDDGSKKLEYYADVITALGAATAASSQEISAGLQKFAAVADTVGLSYEKATAALATVVAETRQSADVVGTAFKTMFARFQGLELGETLEDGVTLNKYSEAIAKVGVNILEANGNLKDMDTILDDLGAKWNTISNAEQVALAETVAGTRQYAQFMAIMDNYDKILANQGIAEGSEGTLQKQADIYAESWEAASKRVRAAAQGIYQDLLDDQFFINALNGFEKFIVTIDKAIAGLGGLKTILFGIGSIIASKYANEMPNIIQKLIGNFDILTGAAEKNRIKMIQDANAIIQSMNAANAGTKGFQAQVASMQLVSKMTTELEAKKKTLSKTEIENYQQRIFEVQMYGSIASAIGQEIDALEKLRVQQSQKIHSKLFQEKNLGIKHEDLEAIEQAEQKVIDLQNQLEKLRKQHKNLQTTKDELSKAKEDLQKLQSITGKTGSQLSKEFESMAKKAGQMTAAYGEVTTRAKSWQQQLSNSNVDVEKMKTEMQGYVSIMKQAGLDTTEFDNILNKENISAEDLSRVLEMLADTDGKLALSLYEADEQVENLKQDLLNLGVPQADLDALEATMRKSGASAQQYAAALENLKKKFQGVQDHAIVASEALSRLASTAMAVSTAINAIKNIGKIWNDEDTTAGEKLLQTLTSVGMLLPAITTLFNAQTIAAIKSAFSIKGLTAAFALHTTGTGAATGATVAFGTALKALPIGWVVSAIGLLVGGIALLAKVIMTPEERLKELKDSQKDFTEATDVAISHWKDLSNTISNYESAYNGIANLTKGTQEFVDTVKQANQEAENLINELGMTFGIDYIFDQNGIKKFTSSGQKKIQDANLKAQRMSGYSIYTDTFIEQDISQLEYDKKQKELKQQNSIANSIWDQYETAASSRELKYLSHGELIDSPEEISQIVSDIQAAYSKEFLAVMDENALAKDIGSFLQQRGIFSGTDNEDAVITMSAILTSLAKEAHVSAPNNYDIPYSYNYANLNAGILQNTNLTDNLFAQQFLANRAISYEEIKQYQKDHYIGNAEEKLSARGFTEDQLKAAVGKDKTFKTYSDYEAFLQMMDEREKELQKSMNKIDSLLKDNQDSDLITNLLNNNLNKVSATDMQRIVAGEFGDESVLKQIFDILFPGQDYNNFINKITKGWNLDDVYRANSKSLDEVRESVKNYNKELKSLKLGDVIQPEIYEDLSEGAKTYFQLMEDGTYKLVGNAEQLQDILFKETTIGFDQNLKERTQINEKTQEDLDYIQANAISYAMASDTLNQLNYVKERFNELGVDTQIQIQAENAALQDLATKYESCTDDLEAYQHTLTTDNAVLIEAAKNTLEYSIAVAELAEKHGFDAKQTEAYAKRLKDNLAQSMKEANFSEKQLEKSALKAAISNQRLDRGLQSLNKNLETYKKSLDTADKNSLEWSTTMDSLKTDLADILDMDISVLTDELAESFLKDAEKSKLLTQALDGNIGAIRRLREIAADDMMINIQSALVDAGEDVTGFMTQWENLKSMMAEAIESGGIDQTALVNSFNELIEKGHMTKDQIEAALAGMHVAADIETDYHEQEMTVPTTITEEHREIYDWVDNKYPNPSKPGEMRSMKVPVYRTYTNTIPGKPTKVKGYVPTYKIKGTTGPGTVTTKVLGANGPVTQGQNSSTSFISDTGESTSPTSNESTVTIAHPTGTVITDAFSPIIERVSPREDNEDTKGGSGSSKKQPAKQYKSVIEESERYHVLNEQLDDLTSAYDKAAKAKDRLYGKNKLQAMQDESKALDDLIKHNQAYLKAIGVYKQEDLNKLLNGGLTKEWVDSQGNLQTFTSSALGFELQFDDNGNLLNYDEYIRAAVEAYNQAVDAYNKAAGAEDVSDDAVNEAEDTFKQAEMQYELVMQALTQYEETNNKFQEKLETIQEQAREAQDKRLEEWSYKLELRIKINDEDKRQLEYFRKHLQNFAKDSFAPVIELLSYWNKDNADSQWKLLQSGADTLKSAAQDLLDASHGDPIIDSETGEILQTFDYSQEDWISKLDECQDQIYSQIDAIYELDDTMTHYYAETLSKAEAQLDKYMTKMEDCTSVLKHFKSISDLLGKDTDYEWIETILTGQRQTVQNELDTSKKEYELAKAQYDKMLSDYEASVGKVDESTRQRMEDELQAQYESMSKWHEKMLSKTEEYAELLHQIYENALKKIGKAFEDVATTGQGWESMMNSMDRVASYQDLILTRTNQVYETNKLMNTLSQDIDKTDSVAHKTKLKNFQQEIKDMQDMNVMSKFDLDVAKARYEILKAQIALEEAQNAKSTVRLQRDNEGNYGYVYTADQDAVDNAKQNLEDKQNDLYNLTLQKANENARALAQLDQEMQAEIERVSLLYIGDKEKREEETNRIIEEYSQRRSILVRDYSEADYWQQQVSITKTNEAYGDYYKQNIADTDTWRAGVSEMVDSIKEAYANWASDVDEEVRPVVGDDLDELKEKTENLTEASEKYADWFDDFADKTDDNLQAIHSITRAYFEQREEIEKLITDLETYATDINKVRSGEAGVESGLTGAVGYDPSVDYSARMLEYYGKDPGEYNAAKAAREAKIRDLGLEGGMYTTGEKFDAMVKTYIEEGLSGNSIYDAIVEWLEKTKRGSFEDWISHFDTGGYTGNGDNLGKLAILHSKELVLNPVDTENLLRTISIVRELSSGIDLRAAASNFSSGLSSPFYEGLSSVVQQDVTIHAEFPNATNHSEIEEAFNTLINRAAQFANRV